MTIQYKTTPATIVPQIKQSGNFIAAYQKPAGNANFRPERSDNNIRACFILEWDFPMGSLRVQYSNSAEVNLGVGYRECQIVQ